MTESRRLLLLSCIFPLSGLSAQEPESVSKKFDKARMEFIGARDAKTLSGAWKELLGQSRSDLRPMVSDSNVSISLAAAWKHAPTRENAKSLSGWNWFLGFLQAKASVQLPIEWECRLASRFYWQDHDKEQKVLESYSGKTKAVSTDGLTFQWNPRSFHAAALGLHAIEGVDVQQSADDLVIKVEKGQECKVPARLIKQIADKYPKMKLVSAAIVQSRLIIALYERYGYQFPLICIDLQAGRIAWEVPVLAMASELTRFRTGYYHHEVRIMGKKASIIVLGADNVLYAEEFQLADGKNILRFSSNAWYSE